MPPRPPINPSPRRFLPKQATRRTPPEEDTRARQWYPTPTTHREDPMQLAPPPSDPRPRTADQFAAAPRFAFGNKARARASLVSSGANQDGDVPPPPPTLVQGLRAKKRIEDVEDPPPPPPEQTGGLAHHHHHHQYDDDDQGNEDEEMLEILPTTEHEAVTITEADPENGHALPFSPKRRKTQHHRLPSTEPEIQHPTTGPSFQRPALPASHPAKPSLTPRFAPARPPSPSSHIPTTTDATDLPTPSHAPTFLRPSLSAHPSGSSNSADYPTAPLPETFSPHRRRQKFVPGGMAATLQMWVLETGQAAVQSRRGQGYARGEEFVMRVVVEDVLGVGAGVVVARVGGGGRREVMFMPNGGGGGEERQAVLQRGCVVGVRAPVWDVQVDGRNVTVAADWKALS